MIAHRQRCAAIAFLILNAVITSTSAGQQTAARNPPPPGLRVEARDGDTVVIQDDARVKIVRQRQAHVRAIFNASDQWLILLVHYRHADEGAVPARVDETFTFNDVTGEWPLGERWEGEAVLEQYAIGFDRTAGPSTGIGLTTPVGIVQLFAGPDPQQLLRDPAAAAVLSHRGFSFGGGGSRTFDEAEQLQTAIFRRNTEANAQLRSGGSMMTTSVGPTGGIAIAMPPGAGAPLRVGGGVSAPRKIHDVAPVLPEAARQANVRGVVILEITIGTDGRVVDARVVRSIPLLDQAALDCVRQWRFEPVQVTGGVVPVMMTATVSFN
jgi:TonB family protein